MSLEEFAEATGVSKSNIYRVFTGKRHLKRMELREMATVAGLPPEFFTADFQLLAAADGARRIVQAMDDAGQDAHGRQAESPEEPGATETPSR